ncbi:MAG: Hsp70 family protein [Alphaproteobacteria bacterium]|nr:Hsp70 family protein [Alphaproteobacteria bacterium]
MPKKNSPALIFDFSENKKNTPVVGIDFGTTCSLVAHGAPPDVIKHDESLMLPTSVIYHEDKTECGTQSALAINSIKRLLGQTSGTAQALGFQVEKGSNITIVTPQGPKTPLEITADFLRHLRQHTTHALGCDVHTAVLTVPAHFSEKARQELRHAASQAGWHILRLLPEPTAAALAYKLDTLEPACYLIYDWGGGTFDISILALEDGVFRVVALSGDSLLGGDDLDRIIAQNLTNSEHPSTQDIAQARLIKESLCLAPSVDWVQNTNTISVTKDMVASFIEPLIQQTLSMCDQAMEDANMSYSDLRNIILVGGTTRLACIQDAIARHMGAPILSSQNPQTVVAMGAAQYGHSIMCDSDPNILIDVLPLSLGIESVGGIVEVIIPRNTPIPHNETQVFTTSINGQKFINISVIQGERDLAQHCTQLGSFTIGPLQPVLAGIPHVEVTFSLDVEGLLTVTAFEKQSQQYHHITLNNIMDPKHYEDTVKDAAQHALADAETYQRVFTKQKALLLLSRLHAYQANHTVSDNILEAQKALQEGVNEDQSDLSDLLQTLENRINESL